MRPFEKLSCFRLLRGRLWGVFDTLLRLGMCDSSKYRCNSPTGYVRPFKKLSRFRPLRGRGVGVCNTPLRLGTCCPSKNCPVFVSFGAACGAYSIRPYDWVRAILRNTDVIPRTGTCEGSKNGSVYATVGGVWWGVCNTPLRLDTCDPSKYRCNFPTGYVRSYEIPMRSLEWRGRGVWEVGRWGLPFAGEVGVNEFGEEEDDDQNNDNKGA